MSSTSKKSFGSAFSSDQNSKIPKRKNNWLKNLKNSEKILPKDHVLIVKKANLRRLNIIGRKQSKKNINNMEI